VSRCLDDNQLAAFVEGKLDAAQSALIDKHLRQCNDCRMLLSALARAAAPADAENDGTRRHDASAIAAEQLVLAGAAPVSATATARTPTPAPIDVHLAQRVGHELKRTYRLERMIGHGGMGVVYAAAHVRLAKRYAIKLLAPSLARSAESLERFRREAMITSHLAHPNIVEVLDFDYTDDGLPFMVMELLRGVDLSRHLLLSGGVLPVFEVEAIVTQTARALAAAHGAGVVHRDLKPSNIFLAHDSDDGEGTATVKVLDFGLSKILDSGDALTRSDALMGSPWYMAPEQADRRFEEIDQRADIFSLAAIAYTMISGHPPFGGHSVPAVLYEVVHRDPQPPRSRHPALPVALDEVIGRALSKDREKRPQTATQLAADLAQALHRGSRRRLPLLPLSLALLLLGGVAIGALLLWLGDESSPTRSEAKVAGGAARAARTPAAPATSLPKATPLRPGARSAQRARRQRAREQQTREQQTHEQQTHEQQTRPSSADRRRRAPTHADHRRQGSRGHGSLLVQTRGDDGLPLWANISIDGSPRGRSALLLKRLRAGRHLILARRAGYRSARRVIRVQPGKRTSVSLQLQRITDIE
jgi:serine/threonine protein kinase